MKTRIFTALLLVCCSLAAFSQTTSVVADRIRAAEYFRIGGNTTQKITGFSTTIPAVPTDFTLPTTKALKDYVVASFMPIGSTAGGDLQGTYPNPTVDALQGVAVSATTPINGQVLKLVAGIWTPTTDAVGPTYTAGSGISIGGNVITNTAPNVTQVLSLDGSELSLSNGGGTVELPGISFPLLAPDGASPYSFAVDPTSGMYTDRGVFLIKAPLGHPMTIQTQTSGTGVPNGFQFNAASGVTGTSGGSFSLLAGNNDDDTAPGGGFSATAGNGTVGGPLELRGGNSTLPGEDGGFLSLYGGASADAFGGPVSLTPGSGVDAGHIGRVFILGAGAVFPSFTITQRNAIVSPQVGLTLFCTDATATDGSTGVTQTWNGSAWKNCW